VEIVNLFERKNATTSLCHVARKIYVSRFLSSSSITSYWPLSRANVWWQLPMEKDLQFRATQKMYWCALHMCTLILSSRNKSNMMKSPFCSNF